jgi:aspartyl/asparaginyl-tRNA synthetase
MKNKLTKEIKKEKEIITAYMKNIKQFYAKRKEIWKP